MQEKQTRGKGLLTTTTVLLALVVIICGWIGVSKIEDSHSMLSGGESPLLKNFEFKTDKTTPSGIVYFDMDYEYAGSEIFASVIIKNKATNNEYIIYANNLESLDLAFASEYVEPGEYTVSAVNLFPTGEEDWESFSTFQDKSYEYSEEDARNNIYQFDFSKQSFIVEDDSQDNIINSDKKLIVDLNTDKAAIGEKINIDTSYTGDYGVECMLLGFTNETDGSKLNVYVKELYGNPYFIIPSNATVGNYKFNYAKITLYSGEKELYRKKDKNLELHDGKFQVVQKEFDPSQYTFNNEDYGDNIENAIAKLDNDAIITVNANADPIISRSLFKLIKNTNKVLFIEYGSSEWVFNGSDIKKPKSVDVRTVIKNIKDSTGYNKFIKKNVDKNSAMVDFSNNGKLPGKVLIKLDAIKLGKIIKGKTTNIYYYAEKNKEFQKVAMEVQKNDGFYEFYIDHNSKYIVSSKEINNSVVSKDESMLELNTVNKEEKDIFNIYTIIALSAGGLLILIGIISLIVTKIKNKKEPDIEEETTDDKVEELE